MDGEKAPAVGGPLAESSRETLDKDALIVALASFVHSAARESPSPDQWWLIQNGAREQALAMGLSESQWDAAMERLERLLEHGTENSPWPSGFF